MPLDREATDELTIRVIALEERPSLVFLNKKSFAQIDVHLTDVNDNSPVFQPSNLYSFSVDAAAETGVIIGQVRRRSSISFPFQFFSSIPFQHRTIFFLFSYQRWKRWTQMPTKTHWLVTPSNNNHNNRTTRRIRRPHTSIRSR